MFQFEITDSEFNLFRSFIYDHAGINLSNEKKNLVTSRLSKRLRQHSLDTFKQYFDLMSDPSQAVERQVVVDLLTTNETYFFREPKHFAFLEKQILPQWPLGRNLRVWSAAASTGEEAYSIAMLLDDMLGTRPWEVFGSDISSRVLQVARQGLYQQYRIEGIPGEFLRKYCLKGVAEHEGSLLIDSSLRKKVRFSELNLNRPLGDIGRFDIIFLRNVLIYFDLETKIQIIKQLVDKMQPDGYLFIGHSETLKGVHTGVASVIPTVYRKI